VNEKIEELFQREHDNPRIWLRVASERLSLLRYVFLVQIEDGIPDADQRSCLEYADAVLIGWPDEHGLFHQRSAPGSGLEARLGAEIMTASASQQGKA